MTLNSRTSQLVDRLQATTVPAIAITPEDLARSPEDFAETMSEEDGLVVILRDELYSGSWDVFLRDMEDRLKGKPYIFKLFRRIEEDVDRIRRLRAYETQKSAETGSTVNLAKYINEE